MKEQRMCGAYCSYTDCPHWAPHDTLPDCDAVGDGKGKHPWCGPCRRLMM